MDFITSKEGAGRSDYFKRLFTFRDGKDDFENQGDTPVEF